MSIHSGNLSYNGSLLFGDLSSGSIFHSIYWIYKKSERPSKSIGPAEIIAAGEAIDDGKVQAKALETMFKSI